MGLREHPDQEFVICMGFDAMRVAMGLEPKNYPVSEVAIWIGCMAKELRKAAE